MKMQDSRVREVRGVYSHFDEDGIIFDVGSVLQDSLSHEERTAWGDVHFTSGPAKATATGVRFEGIT